jgi:hypothetical protein
MIADCFSFTSSLVETHLSCIARNCLRTGKCAKRGQNPSLATLFRCPAQSTDIQSTPEVDVSGAVTNIVSVATPNPVAKVALKATLSPTLGITGFTLKPIFPPPWPPLPGWLRKLRQSLFG